MKRLLELWAYFQARIGVRQERASLELRRKTTRAVIAVAIAVPTATLLIAASLRIVNGLAGGLARLFGGRPWLGDLSAGLVLLGGLAALGALLLARRDRKELREQQEKYERLHREHRARHGRHVSDVHATSP